MTSSFEPAGPPDDGIVAPEAVVELARGRAITPVWENEAGGLTFSVGTGAGARFIKWAPAGSGLDLWAEADRLRWAAAHVTVPQVVAIGDAPEGSWLVTRALPGASAVSPRWLREPVVAVRAIGTQLRRLHDRLPVLDCPFSWSVEDRLATKRARATEGPLQGHPDLTVAEALEIVAQPPAVDRLVVCHGDPCAPNTIVGDDGRPGGVVDLGALGVADRWADLAVATWSTVWNYGPGWERTLLDAYGIAPDEDRSAYYRLLWALD